MDGKFYADRPDKDAKKVPLNYPQEWYPLTELMREYYNPFLKVRYIPRPWWKFWAPKYEVRFEGQDNETT